MDTLCSPVARRAHFAVATPPSMTRSCSGKAAVTEQRNEGVTGEMRTRTLGRFDSMQFANSVSDTTDAADSNWEKYYGRRTFKKEQHQLDELLPDRWIVEHPRYRLDHRLEEERQNAAAAKARRQHPRAARRPKWMLNSWLVAMSLGRVCPRRTLTIKRQKRSFSVSSRHDIW